MEPDFSPRSNEDGADWENSNHGDGGYSAVGIAHTRCFLGIEAGIHIDPRWRTSGGAETCSGAPSSFSIRVDWGESPGLLGIAAGNPIANLGRELQVVKEFYSTALELARWIWWSISG